MLLTIHVESDHPDLTHIVNQAATSVANELDFDGRHAATIQITAPSGEIASYVITPAS